MAKCCTSSKYDKNVLLWLYNRVSPLNYDLLSMKISVSIQALLPVLHLFMLRKKSARNPISRTIENRQMAVRMTSGSWILSNFGLIRKAVVYCQGAIVDMDVNFDTSEFQKVEHIHVFTNFKILASCPPCP